MATTSSSSSGKSFPSKPNNPFNPPAKVNPNQYKAPIGPQQPKVNPNQYKAPIGPTKSGGGSGGSGGSSSTPNVLQQAIASPSNVLTQAISNKAPSTYGKSQPVVTENYRDSQTTQKNIQAPSTINRESSIQSSNVNQPAGGFYSQGFLGSLGQSVSILGSNIKYNVGAAFLDKPYYWESTLKPFEYSTPEKANQPNVARGIKSGTIVPGSSPYMTNLEVRNLQLSSTPSISSTGEKGVAFNIPGTNDLYDRSYAVQEFKSIGTAVGIAAVSVVQPEIGVIYSMKNIQENTQKIFNPSLTKEERIQAGIITGASFAMLGPQIKYSYLTAELSQVKASQEYLTQLNKAPVTGKAQYTDGGIKYSFNRNIATDSGRLISSGESQFQLTGPNTFRGFGIQDTTMSVRGIWSGNIYGGSQSTLSVIPQGKIYSPLGEVNPSISNPTFNLNFYKSSFTFVPGKSFTYEGKVNLKNWYSIPVAGRTTQQGQFLLTESGQIGRININKQLGFTENQLMENTRISGLIEKGGRGIFKLEPIGIKDIQGGLGEKAGGSTGSLMFDKELGVTTRVGPLQTYGELTKISPFTTSFNPTINLPTYGTGSLLSIGATKSISSLKLSTSTLSSTKSSLKIGSQLQPLSLVDTSQINNLKIGQLSLTGTSTTSKTLQETFSGQITTPSTGGGTNTPGFFPRLDIPFFLLDLPSLGGFAIGNPRKRRYKASEFRIAPSFTGIITGIKLKDSLKVSKQFGVSPTQFRGLAPTTKKGKSKPYFKFTDI